MRPSACGRLRGFTLIELLVALLVLSLLALMSYRGLSSVLDARTHVRAETDKWRSVSAFFTRFEGDIQLAAPRTVRAASGEAPAWLGRPAPSKEPGLEFSRFPSMATLEGGRRTGYRFNENGEVELWLWPGPDTSPGARIARHVVLSGVRTFELQYLNADAVWIHQWPVTRFDPPIPRAVRVRIVLESREELVRVFALKL